MKKVKCPVCLSSDLSNELDYTKDFKSYEYLRCNSCSLIFISDTISADYGKDYYKRGKKGLIGKAERVYVRFSNIYKKHIVEKNITRKTNPKILDIGSGEGDFLDVLGSSYNREGVELNKNTKTSFKGVKMYYSSIYDLRLKKSVYDAVTLWHVLEHVNNPQKLLRIIRGLLKEKGILVLSLPNIDSMGYRLAKSNWFHFDFPYHKAFYNTKSVLFLANRTGFELKRSYKHTCEFPLDLFWSILKSKKGALFIPIYPIVKLLDNETLIYILQKK